MEYKDELERLQIDILTKILNARPSQYKDIRKFEAYLKSLEAALKSIDTALERIRLNKKETNKTEPKKKIRIG